MKVVHEITTFAPPTNPSKAVPKIRQTRNDPGEPRDNPKVKQPSKESKHGIRKRGDK